MASAGCAIRSDREQSTPEIVDEPQNQADYDADHDTRDQREIKGAVLAVINDVARPAAEAEGKFWAEVQECAEDQQDGAGQKEQAAELLAGVHREIVALIWGGSAGGAELS